MADYLDLRELGGLGVNTDLSPLHKGEAHFIEAQNIMEDSLGGEKGLRTRPGLTKFNADAAGDSVLGGVSVPLTNLFTGTRLFYIGRGTKA